VEDRSTETPDFEVQATARATDLACLVRDLDALLAERRALGGGAFTDDHCARTLPFDLAAALAGVVAERWRPRTQALVDLLATGELTHETISDPVLRAIFDALWERAGQAGTIADGAHVAALLELVQADLDDALRRAAAAFRGAAA
jgi:hypothetical protein